MTAAQPLEAASSPPASHPDPSPDSSPHQSTTADQSQTGSHALAQSGNPSGSQAPGSSQAAKISTVGLQVRQRVSQAGDQLGQSLRQLYASASSATSSTVEASLAAAEAVPPPLYHSLPGVVPFYQGRVAGPPPSYDEVVNPFAPPPSYQALFGQMREARKSSRGLLDLARRLLIILASTLGCTLLVGLLILIPFTMIIVGAVYIDKCNIEHIPAFLLTGGLVWAAKNILHCYAQCRKQAAAERAAALAADQLYRHHQPAVPSPNLDTRNLDTRNPDTRNRNRNRNRHRSGGLQRAGSPAASEASLAPSGSAAGSPAGSDSDQGSSCGLCASGDERRPQSGPIIEQLGASLPHAASGAGLWDETERHLAAAAQTSPCRAAHATQAEGTITTTTSAVNTEAAAEAQFTLETGSGANPFGSTAIPPGQTVNSTTRLKSSICESLLNCVLFGWFIAGCVIVFRNYEPDFENVSSLRYCHKTVYMYTFWLITSALLLFGLLLSFICCLIVSTMVAKRQDDIDLA